MIYKRNENIAKSAILLLTLIFCSIFIDMKISDYYVFEIFLGLSCIGTLFFVVISKQIILLKHYILIPFFLMVVWSLAEMLIFKEGLKYAPKYFIFALIEIWIFINLVIQYVRKDNHRMLIKYTSLIFIVLAIIMSGYYSIHGAIINSNDFVQSFSRYLLGFGAISCYFLLLTERRTAYGILSYLLLIPCILSTNRKMWLAIFIVYVAMTVLYFWGPVRKSFDSKEYRKLKILVFSFLGSLVVSAIVSLLLFPKVAGTISQTFSTVKTGGDAIRRYVNIHAKNSFMQSPMIGNGWGDRIYIDELGKSSIYHNTYLAVLCQLGLIGFLLYCSVFFYSLVKSFVIMFKKPEHFDYGLFILMLWLFAAVILFFMPLNRMPYYLWVAPLVFTLVFEAWEAKKTIHIGMKK